MNMVEHVPILEVKNLEVNRGGAILIRVPSLFIHEGEISLTDWAEWGGEDHFASNLVLFIKALSG